MRFLSTALTVLVLAASAQAQDEAVWSAHQKPVLNLRFSTDGQHLISTGLGETVVWDWRGRTPRVQWALPALAADVSDDGARVFVQGKKEVRVFNVNKQRFEKTIAMPADVFSLEANGGALFVGVESGELLRVDPERGKVRWKTKAHPGVFMGIAVNKGLVVTAGKEGSIKLWQKGSGKLVRELKGHPGAEFVDVDHKSKVLVSGGDGKLIFWDAQTGEAKARFHVRVNDLRVDRKRGRVVVAANDGLSVWDIYTQKRLQALGGYPFKAAAISPDGERILGVTQQHEWMIREYQRELFEHPLFLKQAGQRRGHSKNVFSLDVSGPRAVTVANDGLRVWELKTRRVERFVGRADAPAVLDPAANLVAYRDKKALNIVNLSTTKKTVIKTPGTPKHLAFDKSGRNLAASGEFGVVMVDVKKGSFTVVESDPRGPVSFSRDGKRLAVGHGVQVEIYAMGRNPTRVATLTGHAFPVDDLAFGKSSDVLASISRRGTRGLVWDLKKKKIRAELVGQTYDLRAVDVDRAGTTVATAGSNGDVALWTLDGERKATLWDSTLDTNFLVGWGMGPGIADIQFTDGDGLLTAGLFHELHLWRPASDRTRVAERFGAFRPYALLRPKQTTKVPPPRKVMGEAEQKSARADFDVVIGACDKGKDVPSALALVKAGKVNHEATLNGFTALMVCAQRDRTELTLALIASGARVSATRKSGEGAVHDAARRGDAVVLQALLKAGVKADAENKAGETPLVLAIASGRKVAAVQALIDAGANVNRVWRAKKARPLEVALALGDKAIIDALKKAGAK